MGLFCDVSLGASEEATRQLGPGGQQSLRSRVAERVRERMALGKTKDHSGASRM